MLKFVKAISVLVVLLAAVTVATVCYFMVFGHDAVRQREKFLNKLSAIEAFRKIRDAMPDSKKQESPLVEQAHKLALRINPPKPPEPQKPVSAKKQAVKKAVEKLIAPKPKPKPVVNTRFNLLATCMVADYPEKSLALINLSAKGHQWVREGDVIEHLTVHHINDGGIVLYQNSKEHSVLNVPEQKTSSLIKAPAAKVGKTIELMPESTSVKPESISVKPESTSVKKVEPSPRKPLRTTSVRKELPKLSKKPGIKSSHQPPRTTTAQKETRKLPARPSKEEQAAARKKSVSKIENIIKDMKTTPAGKEQAEAIANFNKLLQLLEKEEGAADSTQKESSEKKK